jgi:hypothetical protein
MMDEIFGAANFRNEIIWKYTGSRAPVDDFPRKHDNILRYTKTSSCTFNIQYEDYEQGTINRFNMVEPETGRRYKITYRDGKEYKTYMGEGKPMEDLWDIPIIMKNAVQNTDYPTQKPETLIERIINASSNPGDLVFDCFMGSGTTQAVAMKLGRRFIGADINLGAVETTTKRLLNISKDIKETIATDEDIKYAGFEIYNVNNYDVFRNPVQARELLVQALELQPLSGTSLYDGEKDGRLWKILSPNRMATKGDLTELLSNFNYKEFEKRREANPNKPVEKITLVCMGHEPDLAGTLELELKKAGFIIDVEVLDILRQRGDLSFRRDAEADIEIENGKLVIRAFYPMNLLSKLSWEKETVDDWRVLVDSIKIDFNYDGAVFNPTTLDIPEKNSLVSGIYTIPATAGTIRVKITDVLSESFEKTIEL